MTTGKIAGVAETAKARRLLRDAVASGAVCTALADAIGVHRQIVTAHVAGDIKMTEAAAEKIIGFDFSDIDHLRQYLLEPIVPLIEDYIDREKVTWAVVGRAVGIPQLKNRKRLNGIEFDHVMSIIAPEIERRPYRQVFKIQNESANEGGSFSSATSATSIEEVVLDIYACAPMLGIDLAAETKLSQSTLNQLGRTRVVTQWMSKQISGVKMPRRWPVASPTGTRRRLQALARWGYGPEEVSEHTSLSAICLEDMTTDYGWMDADADVCHRVAQAFSKLELQSRGPNEEWASFAASEGWGLPLQWDEDAIDNPRGWINPNTAREEEAA